MSTTIPMTEAQRLVFNDRHKLRPDVYSVNGDGAVVLAASVAAEIVADAQAIAVIDTAAARKAALVSYANAAQWAKAEGGLEVDLGSGLSMLFPTDAVSRGLLNGAVARAQAPSPPDTFRWQTGPSTFQVLSASQVVLAGVAVADYVQATFDTLALVVEEIDDGTITTEAEIDAAFAA